MEILLCLRENSLSEVPKASIPTSQFEKVNNCIYFTLEKQTIDIKSEIHILTYLLIVKRESFDCIVLTFHGDHQK